jgi:hypothetical protein
MYARTFNWLAPLPIATVRSCAKKTVAVLFPQQTIDRR